MAAGEGSIGGGSIGPSTDRHNDPVIDPTKNVLDLVESAIKRQDDLRTMQALHTEEMASLRATYDEKLAAKESQRIDAIRAVDVAASQQATKDAEVRASALAKQVSDAAEQQRNQVAAAAQAQATSLAAALVPIQERLAELTRLQYEQQGQKAQVQESRDVGAERRDQGAEGRSQATLVLGVVLGLVTLLMAVVAVYALSHPAVATPTQPAVVTVTTPAP